MSASLYNEDAEIRVGVVVRPLRGHWRPASGQRSQKTRDVSLLDPAVWKTAARDYDNEAKMQFTSKMVYSNQKQKEADRYLELGDHSKQPAFSSVADHLSGPLVTRCPSTCECGASSAAISLNSPPPESNRIKLPPDLVAEEEKEAMAIRRTKPSEGTSTRPEAWTASSKTTPKSISKEEERITSSKKGSASSSVASSVKKEPAKKSDSSEEITVTTRPLPKPQKIPLRSSEKGSNRSDRSRPTSMEQFLGVKEDQKARNSDRGTSQKDSLRMRVTFDPHDSTKNRNRSAVSSGRGSRATSPGRKNASGTGTPENRVTELSRQDKPRPIRANLMTTSRSRLKTVTYKEEPFMSEFKSWVLLIIFLSMIWLYRSTLFA
ncbi:hypothetical protein RB195_002580 [Necator americanus]|uniref:Uncharacterized protein n=1 Tax=Necator americanus TaxID=51031 RepID=A0ABR1DJP1_NECAM